MVCYCCAYDCQEKFVKGGTVTFHSFPKDVNRRKLWEVQLKRANFKVTDFTKICSKHFEEKCYDKTKFGGTWLKPDAIPTIFNFPDHLMKTINRKTPEGICDAEASSCQEQDSAQEPALKRKCYLGDFEESDMVSPTQARKFFHITQTGANNSNKVIRNLRKKTERMKKKISSLTEMLNKLKKKNLVSDSASSALEDHFEPDQFEQHRLDGWKKLKPTAVPTIFNISKPSNCQTFRKQEDVTSDHTSVSSVNSSTSSSHQPSTDEKLLKRQRVCELHFADGTATRTLVSNLFSDVLSVIERQKPVLKIDFVPSPPPNLSVDSSIASRIKNTPHIFQITKEQNTENIPINGHEDTSDNIQDKAHKEQFSYTQLAHNLHCIQKPNSWWTISSCQDFIICAKWDSTFYCDRKVIIFQDLTVKVFLRDIEIPSLAFNTKICNIGSLSALLHSIDNLVIYQT